MPNVSRIDDLINTGHGCDTTAPIIEGSSNVLVNGIGMTYQGAAIQPHKILVGDDCIVHQAFVNQGSPDVIVNGIPVARIGDSADRGQIIGGSGNVFANGFDGKYSPPLGEGGIIVINKPLDIDIGFTATVSGETSMYFGLINGLNTFGAFSEPANFIESSFSLDYRMAGVETLEGIYEQLGPFSLNNPFYEDGLNSGVIPEDFDSDPIILTFKKDIQKRETTPLTFNLKTGEIGNGDYSMDQYSALWITWVHPSEYDDKVS